MEKGYDPNLFYAKATFNFNQNVCHKKSYLDAIKKV